MFVPMGPINNIPTMVQIMAWCWPDDKPLSEPMVIGLLTIICITRPQWVNGDDLTKNLTFNPETTGLFFFQNIIKFFNVSTNEIFLYEG